MGKISLLTPRLTTGREGSPLLNFWANSAIRVALFSQFEISLFSIHIYKSRLISIIGTFKPGFPIILLTNSVLPKPFVQSVMDLSKFLSLIPQFPKLWWKLPGIYNSWSHAFSQIPKLQMCHTYYTPKLL